MPGPSDYKELLSILNRHRVKYLVVGAYAVIHYTEPRYTKDLDIWVEPEVKNAEKVYKALKEFGAPLKDTKIKDFANKNLIYQIGIEPVRIDIIMGLPGMEFKPAWRNRKTVMFESVRVNLIGINELIKSKERTKRQMDDIDLENLQRSLKLRGTRSK